LLLFPIPRPQVFIAAIQLVQFQFHGLVVSIRTDSRTGRISDCVAECGSVPAGPLDSVGYPLNWDCATPHRVFPISPIKSAP
jgi:hypothetical protein